MNTEEFNQKIEKEISFFESCDSLSRYFENQLNLIHNNIYRAVITDYLDNKAEKLHFERATSSSGKYHPSFQNGKVGNGIHTKNVIKILQVFERAHPELNWDAVYAAAILHDSWKYGYIPHEHTLSEHPILAAESFKNFIKNKDKKEKYFLRKLKKTIDLTYKCIFYHDGRFNDTFKLKTDASKVVPMRKIYRKINTAEQHLLHLADMISSSKDLYENVF